MEPPFSSTGGCGCEAHVEDTDGSSGDTDLIAELFDVRGIDPEEARMLAVIRERVAGIVDAVVLDRVIGGAMAEGRPESDRVVRPKTIVNISSSIYKLDI